MVSPLFDEHEAIGILSVLEHSVKHAARLAARASNMSVAHRQRLSELSVLNNRTADNKNHWVPPIHWCA